MAVGMKQTVIDGGSDADGGGEEHGTERERAQATVVARQQVTYAMREWNAAWAEHGAAWERWWAADSARGVVTKVVVQGRRACMACGAPRCSVMHAGAGACAG